MIRAFLSVVVLLIWSAVGITADVKIEVDQNPIKKDSFAVLSVAAEKGDMVAFQVYPAPVKRESFGNKLVMSGKSGQKYTVLVTVVNFGEKPNKPETKDYKERFDTGQIEVATEGAPGPLPPGPPDPDIPPDPEDPDVATLRQKLSAGLKNDPEGEKYLVRHLAALYLIYASEMTVSSYKTYGDLNDAIGNSAKMLGVTGKIQSTQKVAMEYVLTKLPGKEPGWDTVSTDPKLAAKTFQTLYRALGDVK